MVSTDCGCRRSSSCLIPFLTFSWCFVSCASSSVVVVVAFAAVFALDRRDCCCVCWFCCCSCCCGACCSTALGCLPTVSTPAAPPEGLGLGATAIGPADTTAGCGLARISTAILALLGLMASRSLSATSRPLFVRPEACADADRPGLVLVLLVLLLCWKTAAAAAGRERVRGAWPRG